MSKHLYLLILINLLSSISNCQNTQVPESSRSGAIVSVQTNRIYNTRGQIVSDSVMAIVKDLFRENHLSLSNIQVYRLNVGPSGYYHVRCYQFYQGLELFTGRVTFHFKNRLYYHLSNELITGVALDTMPKISMNTAGIWFDGQIARDPQFKDSLNAFRDHGYNAELGIWDLNSGVSNMPKNFVLAWQLTVANEKKFPIGYVRADSLRLIYYDNGIRY